MTTVDFELRSSPPAAAAHRAQGTVSGIALLAALAIALTPGLPPFTAVLAAACGVTGLLAVAAPGAWRALRGHPTLVVVGAFVILAGAWLWTGLSAATAPQQYGLDVGVPAQFLDRIGGPGVAGGGWPWRLDGISVLPLMIAALAAAGGLVLIADAVRVQLGIARPPRTPWRMITTPMPRGGRIASRAVPGIALVIVATFLAFGLASQVAGDHPLLETWIELGVGAWGATLIAGPIGIGVATALDRDKAGRARERERQRFAAHLHDSVLQTLALVQRQANDPAAVIRLARRQEHALRAWMAGEAELAGDTVTAALREVVAEVEDEHGTAVEVSTIGDRALDARGEELVAAAREALRNAARHAPGALVFVFSDIDGTRAELFIRDEGPGFDPDAVPVERRGLRDAVIGRLAAAGGSATVDSAPGQGTEIALRLPWNGRAR